MPQTHSFLEQNQLVFTLSHADYVLCQKPKCSSQVLCQQHTIFVPEELDQITGFSLYPTLHSFIPHSKFSESSNSKMSLMFPDETIWDQDTFSHQESILYHVIIHIIVNDIHTKSHLLIMLLLIKKKKKKKRATSGQWGFFNCILLETEKPPWLIYSQPCKKPTQISGLTHLPSKTWMLQKE